MKKVQSVKNNSANFRQTLPQEFSYSKILQAFKELGYVPDVESKWVTVLREVNFPFHRLVIPKDNKISVELLSFLAKDVGIPLNKLLKLLQ